MHVQLLKYSGGMLILLYFVWGTMIQMRKLRSQSNMWQSCHSNLSLFSSPMMANFMWVWLGSGTQPFGQIQVWLLLRRCSSDTIDFLVMGLRVGQDPPQCGWPLIRRMPQEKR